MPKDKPVKHPLYDPNHPHHLGSTLGRSMADPDTIAIIEKALNLAKAGTIVLTPKAEVQTDADGNEHDITFHRVYRG